MPRITLTYTPFAGRVLTLSPKLQRSVRLAWNRTGNAVTDEFVRLVAEQRAKAGTARGKRTSKRASKEK